MTNKQRFADICLGVLSVLATAVTAVMIGNSWGGLYWVLGVVTAVVVTAIALQRYRFPQYAAFAGLALTLVAIIIASIAGLPREPGPGTIVALAVLVGSGIRQLPTPWAAAVGLGGLAIVIASALLAPSSSSSTVTILATAGWIAAAIVGLALRAADGTRRRNAFQY